MENKAIAACALAAMPGVAGSCGQGCERAAEPPTALSPLPGQDNGAPYVTAAGRGGRGDVPSAQSYLGFNTIILMQPALCSGREAAAGAEQGGWLGLGEISPLPARAGLPETPLSCPGTRNPPAGGIIGSKLAADDGWQGRCQHCTGASCRCWDGDGVPDPQHPSLGPRGCERRASRGCTQGRSPNPWGFGPRAPTSPGHPLVVPRGINGSVSLAGYL